MRKHHCRYERRLVAFPEPSASECQLLILVENVVVLFVEAVHRTESPSLTNTLSSHQHQKFLLLPELDPGLILDALEVLQWWRTLVEESECDFAIHAYLIQILLLHRFLNRGTASLDQPSKVTAAL